MLVLKPNPFFQCYAVDIPNAKFDKVPPTTDTTTIDLTSHKEDAITEQWEP